MVLVVPSYKNDPHDACCINCQRLQYQQQEAGVPDPGNNKDTGHRTSYRWMRRRPLHKQADCLFAFLSCTILILVTYLLVTETSVLLSLHTLALSIPRPFLLPIFTRTLLYSIITLDSMKNPDQQQNINFFPVPGRYVPLFHVVFGLLMGYRINETIHGIAVGFIYAYLVHEEGQLALALGRTRLLYTSQWLVHLVGEDGVLVDVTAGYTDQDGASTHISQRGTRDITFIQSQINLEVESAVSAAEIATATASFRQQDRNGWQPLHEAARSGQLDGLRLLLGADLVEDEQSKNQRTWRRRAGKLKVNVNTRTNNGRGVTALHLVEENHGEGHACAVLLRQVGGLSLGCGEKDDDD